jgi:hypothetical protein
LKEKWHHILGNSPCPDIEELIQYSLGNTPEEKVFAIEDHLADCPVCSDLLDGIRATKNLESIGKAELEISERLQGTLFAKKGKSRFSVYFRRYGIAASIVLLAGITALMHYELNHGRPGKETERKPRTATITTREGTGKATAETGAGKTDTVIQEGQLLSQSTGNNASIRNKETNETDHLKQLTGADRIDGIRSVSGNAQLSSETAVYSDSVRLAESHAESLAVSSKLAQTAGKENVSGVEFKTERNNSQNSLAVNKTMNRLVRGVVKDISGEPLPGVTVVYDQSKIGTVTDKDGRFSIPVIDNHNTVAFSFIGYEPQSVDLKNSDSLFVTLNPSNLALNEVVVTGYGTKKKAAGVGSVAYAESRKIISGDIPDERRVDSLVRLIQLDNTNRTAHKELALQYILLKRSPEALRTLEKLNFQPVSDETRQQVDKVKRLVEKTAWQKAFRALNKIEIK